MEEMELTCSRLLVSHHVVTRNAGRQQEVEDIAASGS
jgi:hypothetical protein